jgi:WhiB family transcriptional regulator, redox-sensing transcriptional regulator
VSSWVDMEMVAEDGDFLSRFAQPSWSGDALCREYPEIRFVAQTPSKRAVAICKQCRVREECLAYAMTAIPEVTGVWGATTTQDRRALRDKDHPVKLAPSRRPAS